MLRFPRRGKNQREEFFSVAAEGNELLNSDVETGKYFNQIWRKKSD